MSPLNTAAPVLACMQDVQEQCFKLGIPLKTRHREVAPNQFELVPLFGTVVTQARAPLCVALVLHANVLTQMVWACFCLG